MTEFVQFVLIGLVAGSVYALIAIGYTMVYGIIELINFAHGDLFMLGSFFALQVAVWVGVAAAPGSASTGAAVLAVAAMLLATPAFCAVLNVGVDRLIYKPVRTATKLAVRTGL
jgi:branched-chain amino acid transport system permease protein